MSGILCVHHPSGIEPDLPRYRAALARLRHRGPSGEGSALRECLFLGVRHSSIEPCSSAQPVATDDRMIFAAVDGHLHNRDELVRHLRGKGHRTDLSSDAAVLLSVYVEYGVRCFERFKGAWALVLWDERSRRLFIGRDPLGVRPLYYYRSARHLLVASEIKSILALDDEARTIDHGRVRDFVRRGTIDDWTFTSFSHIRPVPPGTVLEFGADTVANHRYWRLRPSTDASLKPADMLERLAGAIDRHMPAEGKVGLALSGGIDSSAIAGILTRPHDDASRIHAFSIHPPHTPDESFLIDATIRRTGLRHTYVSLDALDYPRTLAHLIDSHDEPAQYSGVLYQFALRQQMAEAGCRSVLVGYGADEIFGGYEYLAPAFLAGLVRDGRWRDARRFIAGARNFLGSSSQDIILTALRCGRADVRTAMMAPLKRTSLYQAHRQRTDARARPLDGSDVLAPGLDDLEPDSPEGAAGLELDGVDRGRIFMRALLRCFRTNVPLLVRQEDRNAASHGLNLCVPFMDEELVRTALSLPFQRYMEGGWNKAVLRDAVAHLLASEVRACPKKFASPGSDAYVAFTILRAEFRDLLNSSSFYQSGLWLRRCRDLYETDSARMERSAIWFRVYMVHHWYERVVRPQVEAPLASSAAG